MNLFGLIGLGILISKIGACGMFKFPRIVPGAGGHTANKLLELIQPVITQENNQYLTAIPEKDEIWQAVQHLDPNSAPGPDGFTGHFFQACWPIIKQDVVNAVSDFLTFCSMPKGMTSSTLIMLNKVKHPTSCLH